ncbi:hypothetical protein ACOTBZ_16940 [Achromobacter xylosoxidans]
MLFGYPEQATAENWIHDCIVAAVTKVHQHIELGRRLPRWPAIILPSHQDKLRRRTGLRDRLSTYAKELRRLATADRQLVLDAIADQNRIQDLLAGQHDCRSLEELPPAIREPALALFTYAFGLLTEFGTRQRQYKAVCDVIPAKVCPYCGCENLEAPGLPQEDLDHYLPRSKYPFAAANLRNLAPMGGRCNSAYKRTQDPLKRDDGTRRRAFYPFLTTPLRISLENSVVDELTPGPVISDWVIEFDPSDEPSDTWDEIFKIRQRWKENFLDDKTFRKWLREFSAYCKSPNQHVATDEEVVDAIKGYQEYLAVCGFEGQAFLKAATFELLHRHCQAGSQRLIPLFRELAGVAQP